MTTATGPQTSPWGTNVKAAREAAGLSQVELASAAGVGPSTIHRIESGQIAEPTSRTKIDIATALGTTADALFPYAAAPVDRPKRGPSGAGKAAVAAALGLAFLIPTASTPAADAAARGVCKPTLRPTLAATASWDGRTLILSGTVPSAVRGTVNTNIAIAGVGTAYNVGAPRAYRVTEAQARVLNEGATATATFHSFPSSFRPAPGQRLDGPSCSMRVA